MEETKIVVLDDDPTGIQTVYDVDVLMSFDEDELIRMLENPEKMVFLSTNSRSLLPEETENLHITIMRNLSSASLKTKRDFLVISRGDSTLRGHYPLESEIIKTELQSLNQPLRGEVLCPYLDGIRRTDNDIHYVLQNKEWIPCADSEFAKDATFGYHHSDLKEYIKEKYGAAKNCVSIPVKMLDGNHSHQILEILNQAEQDSKIIINAHSMSHIEAFVKAIDPIKHLYQYRTAASFVKALAHLEDKEMLDMNEICDESSNGGLILAGSHVQKTTSQIDFLLQSKLAEPLILDVERDIKTQIEMLARKTDELLKQGKNVIVMTSRNRIDFEGNAFDQLKQSREISEQFVSLIPKLTVRPKFLISKGGITSFDVLKKGLKVSSARVLGQVSKNIPAVRLGENSIYPGLCVVVFPGNVGENDTLSHLVNMN